MSDGEEPELREDAESDDGAVAPDPAFGRLLEKLHIEHNSDFREYKEGSLLRRIRRRMAQVRIDRVDDYITFLDRHPGEHTALLNVILINVTRFFRDVEAWDVLRDRVLPVLLEHATSTRSLRIWSAGCSSGEEPCSIAMLVADALGDDRDAYDVKIYGTDVDEDALATARTGLYRLEQIRDVPRDVAERYFYSDGQAFRIRRDLRKWCIFGRHDLTQDAPLSHMDLLVCRNVLIYFDTELQGRLLPRFHYATRNDGFLFLGRSESLLSRSRHFVPIDFKWRLFQRVSSGGEDLPQPSAFAARERLLRQVAQDEPAQLPTRAILESLTSAVIVIDADETIVAWNAAAEALFEIPALSALGKKFRDLDVSYRIEGLRAHVEEVRSGHGRSQLPDIVFSRRSGDMTHVNLAIAALVDDRRRPTGVLIVGEDISEYGRLREELDRQAEQSATANEELQSTNEELETTNEELQSTNEELETTNEELQSTNEELETTVEELQSINAELGTLNSELERRTADLHRTETFHRAILDTLRPGLFVLDPSFVVTHWNGQAARMWGLQPDAATGREFFTLPIGAVTAAARDVLHAVRDDRRPARVADLGYTLPGGERRRATLDLSPIISPNGELLGVLGIAADDGPAAPGAPLRT